MSSSVVEAAHTGKSATRLREDPLLPSPMIRLATAVQELSLARDLNAIAAIVKRYARALISADGASFVLRDGDLCYYMAEDAIAPLWKGQRFPMTACISGWVMLNRVPVVIPDIYSDSRIPVDAYRPTFVRSLAMVPIRTQAPIGAIGAYWSRTYTPSLEEITVLSALADSAAVAFQNTKLQDGLSQIQQRAQQLESYNRELDAFSSSVSHDLRAPLRTIRQFTTLLLEDKAAYLDAESKDWLGRIEVTTARMSAIIEDLLRLASISQRPLRLEPVDLSALSAEIVSDVTGEAAPRECAIEAGLIAEGDPGLIRILLENLLSNAWKYSSQSSRRRISVGRSAPVDGAPTFFVRDNGVGIASEHLHRLFKPFERLHTDTSIPGVGLGLATVKRIVERHQGAVRVESETGHGTTIYFSFRPGPVD